MKKFSRRDALISTGVGISTIGLASCGERSNQSDLREPQRSKGTRVLKMVTSWPKGLPGVSTTAAYLAARIEGLSEGGIKIEMYSAGELVPALEVFDAVASGNADMYHSGEGYWTSKSRAYPFYTSVPMGMTAVETTGWLLHGGGQELWDELSGQYGIKPLMAGNTGSQMGGFFKREIGPDGFAGLKYRIAGMGADVVRALGGSSVLVPGAELFTSLDTGVIDAAEFAGPWNDYSLGLFQAAPYYYGPGFAEPGSIMSLGINRKVWDSMSNTEQLILEAASRDATIFSLAEYRYRNAQTLQNMRNDPNIKVRTFPSALMDEIKEVSPDIRFDAGNGGGLERRIADSYENALNSFSSYSTVSEGMYYGVRDM